MCSLVDLFVHSSGPFGGPFSDWGVLQSPENPPWLRPCRCDTTVIVLSWKDIVVQAPEDSSWYAESMKTAGTVNN